MKKILILLFCLVSVCSNAQTAAEIFQQKKTQRKYLLEQIAQLQLYSSYLSKGYNILKTGLGVVSDITDNEKNLHEKFFAALGVLSPALKTSPKITEILLMQIELVQTITKIKKSSSSLKTGEVAYISSLCNGIVQNTENLIDILMVIAENNRTDMNDKNRAERIEQLYTESLQNYHAAGALYRQIQSMLDQRKHDQNEVKQLEKLYLIK